ncbi:MAG: hypothetical protein IJL17_15810 [Kiritimatiellae bacterium]|nr:hypothetical protein [Kiritimatiellia bacterium]
MVMNVLLMFFVFMVLWWLRLSNGFRINAEQALGGDDTRNEPLPQHSSGTKLLSRIGAVCGAGWGMTVLV